MTSEPTPRPDPIREVVEGYLACPVCKGGRIEIGRKLVGRAKENSTLVPTVRCVDCKLAMPVGLAVQAGTTRAIRSGR